MATFTLPKNSKITGKSRDQNAAPKTRTEPDRHPAGHREARGAAATSREGLTDCKFLGGVRIEAGLRDTRLSEKRERSPAIR